MFSLTSPFLVIYQHYAFGFAFSYESQKDHFCVKIQFWNWKKYERIYFWHFNSFFFAFISNSDQSNSLPTCAIWLFRRKWDKSIWSCTFSLYKMCIRLFGIFCPPHFAIVSKPFCNHSHCDTGLTRIFQTSLEK